jgi:hypothetical protein
MRALPSNMHLVEESPEDSYERVVPRQTAPVLVKPVAVRGLVKPVAVKPIAVRPIAMKVVRPIPQRISDQFYNEAFENGLTMQETNNAAVMAHDWHRRWTQQDEVNHTMPDEDFYARSSNLPTHYDADVDRQGAMNPSLGDSDEVPMPDERIKRSLAPTPVGIDILASEDMGPLVFNPEDRLSASSWSDSVSSSLSSHMAPQVKRRFTGAVIERDLTPSPSPEPVAPAPTRPVAVRPVAVRLNRPGLPLAHDIPRGGVPNAIFTPSRKIENVSPMSVSDDGSASIGSENFLMTVMNKQNEQVHVIEQEDVTSAIETSRDSLLQSLAASQGDVESDKFKSSLDTLSQHFSQQALDTRPHLTGTGSIEDTWLTLSKPSYFGCLGENDNGDPMYTMGRMSFDMFSPTNLVCSLQGNFNLVEIVAEEDRKELLDKVPKSLREEVECRKTVLRTYHVVSAFTIEPSSASFPDAPNKDVHRPIRGIMTTYGYSLPDPKNENRHSIWFTGGKIEPNTHPRDVSDWKRLFTMHPPKHSFGEKAKLLAVKLLMGATVPDKMAEDGIMSYEFTRPLGGHGMAYVDVVYLDETLRIVKGHRGTVMVFSRLPSQS